MSVDIALVVTTAVAEMILVEVVVEVTIGIGPYFLLVSEWLLTNSTAIKNLDLR